MVTSQPVAVDAEVRLRVLVRPGEGIPFLLVHGLASNARLWDGVAERLAAAGCPSAAVDQRAHGESDRVDGGFDFATLAADLAAVVDRVFGRKVVAAGQSWGGNVVLELAHRHPDRVAAVALVDGGFIRLADPFPVWEEAAAALAPPIFDGLTRGELELGARARFAGWPETGIRAQLANFEELADGTVRPRLTRERHMRILRELWEHHPDETAAALDLPVVVLVADGDGLPGKDERVEAFGAALRRGRVVHLTGHHDLHAQQPEAVAGVLLELAASL
jgi:pimeloyl-ACP methyl ester carboxylesterase